jgi:hypothetical protein
MLMKTLFTLAAVAAALTLAASAARADTLSNGFNAGTGQPQDIFTVSTQNGIELGLAAQPRGASLPAVTDEGNGTYLATTGTSSGRALWNFDFSIDANPTNAGTGTLAGLEATLSVTGPNGLSGSFNALNPALGNVGVGNVPSTTLAQNSENMTFNLFGAPIGFDPNLAGTYTFTLNVSSVTGAPLATDTINVDVSSVPLPSAAGMGLATLAFGGGTMLLRKKLRLA